MLPTTTASAPRSTAARLGQVGAAGQVDGAGGGGAPRPARVTAAPGDDHGPAVVDQRGDDRAGVAGADRRGRAPTPTGAATTYGRRAAPAGGSAAGRGAAGGRRHRAARACPAAAARASARSPRGRPPGHRRRWRRRASGGAGRPAATRGSPRCSPRRGGSPASRHSSAIGSGLWWNEVKTTAWSYDRLRSSATSAVDRGGICCGSVEARPWRVEDEDVADEGSRAAAARPERRDQQVDLVATGGEGPDGGPGQQDVAVVVEPHREDPSLMAAPPEQDPDSVDEVRCHAGGVAHLGRHASAAWARGRRVRRRARAASTSAPMSPTTAHSRTSSRACGPRRAPGRAGACGRRSLRSGACGQTCQVSNGPSIAVTRSFTAATSRG